MSNKAREIRKGNCLFEVAGRLLVKLVGTDIKKASCSDSVAKVAYFLSGSVSVDKTRLDIYLNVVLLEHSRTSGFCIVVRDADLRSNCHKVLSNKLKILCFLNREVTRLIVVSDKSGQVGQGHGLWVIANRSFVKDVLSTLESFSTKAIRDNCDYNCVRVSAYCAGINFNRKLVFIGQFSTYCVCVVYRYADL